MKREIKYRAWDKKDKVMRTVYALLFKRISNKGNRTQDMVEMHCGDMTSNNPSPLSHFTRPLKEVDLMEFTGLWDFDGNRIYEGDILSRGDGWPITKVVWNKYGFAGKEKGKLYDLGGCDFISTTRILLKIIGNKWETEQVSKDE